MRVSFVVILELEGGVNTSVQHSRTWIEYGDVGIAWVAKQDVQKLTTMMETRRRTNNRGGTTFGLNTETLV